MKEQQELKDLAAIGAIYPENYIGFVNDLTGYYRDPIPFDEVQTPTFILHGDKDKDVDFSNAEQAYEGIANSELRIMEGGGHYMFLNEGYKEDFQM